MRGGEVAVDQVRRRVGIRVLPGRGYAPLLAQERALQAVLAHQSLDPFAGDVHAAAVPGGVDPRRTVGATGAVVDLDDLGEQLLVGSASRRRVPLLGDPAVERRGCDIEDLQDRVDPEPVTEMVEGFQYRLFVGSISWAKKALAAFKISLARRSSVFSFRSRRSSSTSALVGRSLRWPRSAWA